MTPMRNIALALIFAMIAAAMLATCPGCQQKFTRQRYETIYTSMPDWQVRNVLGEPTERSDGEWTYVNKTPYYRAQIRFEKGQVAGKSWSVERSAAASRPAQGK
jgi:hypothetical protein